MELDAVRAPNGLSDVFGDRNLCRHNRVFACIRDAVIAAGFTFSEEDTPLWRDYQSLSLTALHRILSSAGEERNRQGLSEALQPDRPRLFRTISQTKGGADLTSGAVRVLLQSITIFIKPQIRISRIECETNMVFDDGLQTVQQPFRHKIAVCCRRTRNLNITLRTHDSPESEDT